MMPPLNFFNRRTKQTFKTSDYTVRPVQTSKRIVYVATHTTSDNQKLTVITTEKVYELTKET